MALIKNGLLGQFSGKIGSVQGARWKKVSYMQGRIVSNGHSQTNQAIAQRNSFANCRSTLSLLKSSWQAIAVGKGSKKLPAWQLWVKQTSFSYPSVSDFFGFNPLITNGSWSFAPAIQFVSASLDSGYWSVAFVNNKPCVVAGATLFYAILDCDRSKWLQVLAGANPYSEDFNLFLDEATFAVGRYQIYCCYASSLQDGRCSSSLAVSFVLS